MKKHGSRFLNSDKIKIVQETKERGVRAISQEYGLNESIVYTWVKNFNDGLYKGREHLTSVVRHPGVRKRSVDRVEAIPPPYGRASTTGEAHDVAS